MRLRRRTAGLWTASAGSALQLVGLSWDSLQHHLDPSLVEKEDVFSLLNPKTALRAWWRRKHVILEKT